MRKTIVNAAGARAAATKAAAMHSRWLTAPGIAVLTLALSACGGGGASSSGSPANVLPPAVAPSAAPTLAPAPAPAPGYVAPQGAVTPLVPSPAGAFASSMLSTSADGTLVVQSSSAPGEPAGDSPSLTEYAVSANESAPAGAAAARRRQAGTAAPETVSGLRVRPRLDPRSAAGRLRGRSPLGAVARDLRARSIRRPASALVGGAQHTFHVLQGPITGVSAATCPSGSIAVGGSKDCYADVSAHLLAVSQHAYVWVDDAVAGNPAYAMSASDWTTTAGTFDADYAVETQAFGPAFLGAPSVSYAQCATPGGPPVTVPQPVPDISGADQHLWILVTAALDNTGEGGYFTLSDMLNDQELNCLGPHVPSNNAPMFVIGEDAYATTAGTIYDPSYWRRYDMPRSLAHEFQHYLHAVNKILAPDLTCTNDRGCGVQDDAFIDEGASMLAEDLVNGGNQQSDTLEIAFEYLYDPGNYSLTAFTGYAPDPLSTATNPPRGFHRYTTGNYGAAYLFMRYLYDRFHGSTMLHALYADTSAARTGQDTHPVVAAAGNGETFAQLYADFAAALAARNVASSDPRFSFSPAVRLTGKTSLPVPGGGTVDVVFNGPRSPDDLNQTAAGPRLKLTPGGAVNAKLIEGATLFFNVAPAGGTATVTGAASAPGGALSAALVQGAYDDAGACLGPAPQC